MNNKRGGFGAKFLLVLILMIASAVGGAYGYRVLDGKLAARDAIKAVENVDISDYDEAEQSVIQGFIDSAKKDIETAKTRKEVYEVISDFIADVAKVQTSNEKKLEEALRAAEEAKQKYNNSNNNSDNSGSNLFNGYNNNNQNTDQSYNTEEPADNTGNSNGDISTDSNTGNDSTTDSSSGNYKSNELSNGQEEEDNNGGFLNSLLGGMSSGSGGN